MKRVLRILTAIIFSFGWIWMTPAQADSASPTPVASGNNQTDTKKGSKEDAPQPTTSPTSKADNNPNEAKPAEKPNAKPNASQSESMPNTRIEDKPPEVKPNGKPKEDPVKIEVVPKPNAKVETNQPEVKSSSKPSADQPAAKPESKLNGNQKSHTIETEVKVQKLESSVSQERKKTEKDVAALNEIINKGEIKKNEINSTQLSEIGKTLKNLTTNAERKMARNLGITTREIAKIAKEMRSNPALAKAFVEFEQRKSDSEETEFEYTLADATSEVQVEEFLQDPFGTIFRTNPVKFLSNFSELGKDMTDDQRKKVQEIVVPLVIIQTCISLVRIN